MARRDAVLRTLLPALAAGKVRLCPRCCHGMFAVLPEERDAQADAARQEGWWPMPPAVSRSDNRTFVCSPCGTEEALEDALEGRVMDRDEWGPRFLDDPDYGNNDEQEKHDE